MNRGFTLLEVLVTLLIVAVLTAVALPYYFNAVESARMTEVVVLWGQQKNWITGQRLSDAQAQRYTQRIQEGKLKYFTGQVLCREKQDPAEICWEAEFTQLKPDAHVRYKLITTHNFTRLACVALNSAGENFCESQSVQDSPQSTGEETVYWVR